jgi:hypothetical protein
MTSPTRPLRQKYESLLRDLDRPLSDSIVADLSFTSTDSCAGLELQQWEQMWSHVISMISEVIPTDPRSLTSWTDRRLSLVSLVSELIRLAKRGRHSKEKVEVREMTAEVRESRAKLETRAEEIEDERKRRIAERLRDVESRLEKHLDGQNVLIQQMDEVHARKGEILQMITVDGKLPRKRRRGHVQELIRATNLIQKDYQTMRMRDGKGRDSSVDPISFLRES